MRNIVRHQRLAGALLHPTSLPGGDLSAAGKWLDFMEDTGLRVWQVLPLGPPHDDGSPYACQSAFAINPALLAGRRACDDDAKEFTAWCARQAWWLEDYVLFRSLQQAHHGLAWYDWPDAFKYRHPQALRKYREEHQGPLSAMRREQYRLYRDWIDLKRDANSRGIFLFGDMPLFVAHDSADVWAHPHRFLLDGQGRPSFVSGVPPDYFSAQGQRWGNPHYDWDVMQAEGFTWWLQRLRHHFTLFDLVRIDHFRGLQAVWMIEAGSNTAVDGHWQTVPGEALLQKLQDEMGEIPLVAEDLGTITEEVTALRRKFGLPGMAVLQFAFDHFADNPHKPENIPPECVVYTGTHDNDTTRGWFDGLPPECQAHVRGVLGIQAQDDVVTAMIDTALNTRANLALFPLQDLLGLGHEARMNTPGTIEGNWRWRLAWPQLDDVPVNDLKQRIRAAQRAPAGVITWPDQGPKNDDA